MFFQVTPEMLEKLNGMREAQQDSTGSGMYSLHSDGHICIDDPDLIKVLNMTSEHLSDEDKACLSRWSNGVWQPSTAQKS